MKNKCVLAIFVLLMAFTIYGCGSNDQAADDDQSQSVVSTTEFGDMVIIEIDDNANDDSQDNSADNPISDNSSEEEVNGNQEVVSLDITDDNPADNIYMHEKKDDEEQAETGSEESVSGEEASTGEEQEKIEVNPLEAAFYGYTENELLSSTIAQLINERMGYKKSKQYSQSDLTFFVPFKTGSSKMAFFADYMNSRTLESVKGAVSNWDSLSEDQRLALAGFAYSGLLPEDVFVYWGVPKETIHSYAVTVASYY